MKSLLDNFKEATDRTIGIKDGAVELFGYLVEPTYRDRLILSRNINHSSECVSLAHL